MGDFTSPNASMRVTDINIAHHSDRRESRKIGRALFKYTENSELVFSRTAVNIGVRRCKQDTSIAIALPIRRVHKSRC